MNDFFKKYGHILLWLVTLGFIWRLYKIDPMFAFLLATMLVLYYAVRFFKNRRSK